ncbi:Magnesium transporter ALR1 [Wickerhamomyces ciferrii]|uniref:Magnesium transporter ALR1 n=1 Tax=Wickerhamomyces ciferrii (strain ATCC 14091 / BCRC 22168 / CBS 111 / JCM 3599 / NBRC 0793 / NRRL Y-1031 F-60-10) TaxID=1206466 RepID=K0KG87_WICCF|nr:Magnesium transporter ALR1 [Wickerhamomyces ciferrii]CCH41971.1 Magnesium transporter ALR1 [Wickerhamomyces ciferrii]
MSDAESIRSISPTRSLRKLEKTQDLYDHRKQPSSLPLRRDSVVNQNQQGASEASKNARSYRASSFAGFSKDEVHQALKKNSNKRGSMGKDGAEIPDFENASRTSMESQDTEQDVCFPLVPENDKFIGHYKLEEIDTFIHESRKSGINVNDEGSSGKSDYSPSEKISSEKDFDQDEVIFGANKFEPNTNTPNRFSFFCADSDNTVHGPDLKSLVEPGESVSKLFKSGEATWWLDCSCPSDVEMRVLAKAFGIHPLTAEDIRMHEAREKVELFSTYYFVSFHTFENDGESENFLEPINYYILVFPDGILSFHSEEVLHAINVRRRVRQLREHVSVSPDWICYALIDDITDSFGPVIHSIEYEADAIEDQVFSAHDSGFSQMLQKIVIARRKVMILMRLLSNKADVIKMFAKRCQDELQNQYSTPAQGTQVQPGAEIALYLSDIQDHIVTMHQSLLSYEKIFSRSHSNYLAQLQYESFNSNYQITTMLSKVTLIGTILVPLNIVTGLFGMNVKVPGQDGGDFKWFFGIFGVLVAIVITLVIVGSYYMNVNGPNDVQSIQPSSSRRSILGRMRPGSIRRETRSIISTPNMV